MGRKKCKGGVCAVNNLPRGGKRSTVNAQLSPLNVQPAQQPYQGLNIGPSPQQSNPGASVNLPGFPQNVFHTPQAAAQVAQNQQQSSPLQQNLAPLQGAQQQQQDSPDINVLLDKVDSGAELQPQEAQALNAYIQQYLPQQQQQQQQGQYNPQDYLKGPLSGLFEDQSQGQDVPYEQSPFFKAASDFQNNPNAPAALKERAKKPGFFQRIWNGIKNIVKGSPVGLAAQALGGGRTQNGSQGSVQAGQQQQQQGYQNDPYGIAEANPGLAQVLSPDGQQRGDLAGTFLGYHPEVYNVSNLTGYQQRASNYILDQSLRGLQQNQPNFNPIANQQLEKFYTQTVPSLAERFTAMGDGQRSSAFQGSLANAGRGLHNDLAAQNQQFNQQNRSNYTNLLNFGLAPRFSTALNPGGSGLLPHAVNAAVSYGKAYATGGLAQ